MIKHRFFMLLLILALTLAFLPQGAKTQGEELVILHSNDLHGQSLARLATLVAEQRELHPNLLLVDGGDLFSGTPISLNFQGQAEGEAVKLLGYDALAIGNHDFDFGQEVLLASLARGVPWLGANIYRADGSTFAPPFVIKEVAGLRVLLIGITSTATPRMSFPQNVEGLTFADPVPILKQILQEQAGNYEICIVLSHLGYGEDLHLAQKVPGITAIIGGHSHTLLATPVRIQDTIITQTGSSANFLGKIVVSLEEGYQARGELLSIKQTTPAAPRILAIEERYEAILAQEMAEVLGYTSRGYSKHSLGQLLVQALKLYAGADAALYNGGGVRSGLPQGAITRRDVFAVEPFGNEAVLVTLSGKDFAELLEIKASRSFDFYEGPRLIDLSRSYTVATSDFLASAGSSYPTLAQGEIVFLAKSVRSSLKRYLQEHVLERELVSSF